MRASLTSALLRFLLHLLLALPLPLSRLLFLLLLSRHRPPLILSSLLPLAFPPFRLRLSGLLLMYQGRVWVLPSLLGYPPISIMCRSLPLQPLPMLPLGLPLMTRMPSCTPYRVLMTLMILMIVSLTKTTLLSIPPLPLLHWIRLTRSTAVWWNTFAVSFRKRLGFHQSILHLGLCWSPPLRLPLTPSIPSLFWFACVQQALIDADSRLACRRPFRPCFPSRSPFFMCGSWPRMLLAMRFR